MRTKILCFVACLAVGCGDDSNGDTGASSTTAGSTTAGSGATTTTTTTSAGTTTAGTSGSGSTSMATTTDGTGSTGAGTGMVAFELTSPVFQEGGIIPSLHHVAGGNVQPALDWVGAPAGTQSFAIFFLDTSINFRHSGIWDIPSTATGIPQDVEHDPMPASVPGAVQCRSWFQGIFGYGGPGSPDNFYEFTLYAIDVPTITEIDQNSSLADVQAAFMAHSLGEATLEGQTEGPP